MKMIYLPLISMPLFLHIAIAMGFSLRLLYRKREVSTTLAWMIILFSLPLVGAVLYFLFGDHRLGRKRMKTGERLRAFYLQAFKISEPPPLENVTSSVQNTALSRNILHDTGFPALEGGPHRLITDAGTLYESLIADIDEAEYTCFLEFYILDPAGRVADVLAAVERAAKRGVDCKILADDFGSKAFFRSHWPKRLKAEGVAIVRSLPVGLFTSFSHRSDLRNHRKLVVIDQTVGYIGSYNLADPVHFKANKGVGQWIDVMMRIEGPIVDALTCVFVTDFLFDTAGTDIGRADLRNLPRKGYAAQVQGQALSMQLPPSGPEMRHATIYEVFVSMIFNATERVRIVTPYFIPDQSVTLALVSAAKRGVDVEVIVPERLDSLMARYASESSFELLLEGGVKIFRYRGGMLHTKAVLIDDEISLFGTVNVDLRSFYLNLELSLIVFDDRFNAELHCVTDEYLADCTELELDVWSQRSSAQTLLENLLRLASPIL